MLLTPLEQFQIISLLPLNIFSLDFSVTNLLLVNILTLIFFSLVVYFFSASYLLTLSYNEFIHHKQSS